MKKDIVLTIWFDNTFGCSSKCSFCYVSEPMIYEETTYDKTVLCDFLELHKNQIYLVKLLGQEPYNENKVLECLDLLTKFGIPSSSISITSVGFRVYQKIYDKIGAITLSFSGFDNSYYGFPLGKEYLYKETIGTTLKNYFDKIDKVNWIIGKFNIDYLDGDLERFFLFSLEQYGKVPTIGFLVQKGVLYERSDIEKIRIKTLKIRSLLDKYGVSTITRLMKKMKVYFDEDIQNLQTREITFCYDRAPTKAWFRCTYEIKNTELSIKTPFLYIRGQGDDTRCTKMCSSYKNEKLHTFNMKHHLYYRLMIFYVLKF